MKPNWFSPPEVHCPFCGPVLPTTTYVAGKPLMCPQCRRDVQPAQGQMSIIMLIALGVTVCGLVLLGLRGVKLILDAIVLFFPIFLLCIPAYFHMFKPRWEEY